MTVPEWCERDLARKGQTIATLTTGASGETRLGKILELLVKTSLADGLIVAPYVGDDGMLQYINIIGGGTALITLNEKDTPCTLEKVREKVLARIDVYMGLELKGAEHHQRRQAGLQAVKDELLAASPLPSPQP